MQKIPTVYIRDFTRDHGRYVTDEVTPGCEWALAGEGAATRKYDGTCVMLDAGGRWWARREVKLGKTPPPEFIAICHDDVTGKTVGWEPIGQSGFAPHHAQAVADSTAQFQPGTYELCGPKVNGNPEGYDLHVLVRHAEAERVDPRMIRDLSLSPADLVSKVGAHGWEGIVWHHPDGRMAKLKARDLRRG